MPKGKRKTQDPCSECYLHKSVCMCTLFPSLDLKTRLLLVIHYKELKRTTNTGRLAVKSLRNSQTRVRGLEDKPLSLSADLDTGFENLLLYPSKDSQTLTKDFTKKFDKPIQLIVPDGNWRQASKVYLRHKELKEVNKVMVKGIDNSDFFLRKETKSEGMATLQAIAYAFGVIEGEEVCQKLLAVYEEKLRRTIKMRG